MVRRLHTSSEELGQYVAAPQPDFVLLDLNLPKRDGIDVLREIKTDNALRHIPVVVFSSSTNEPEIQEAYQAQANCFITKPGSVDGLFKVFEAIEAFWFVLVTRPSVKPTAIYSQCGR